ncbi:MAG: hypothetical protein Q8O39_00915 [bacterium]|nr:hypothetical protein [bacterium]
MEKSFLITLTGPSGIGKSYLKRRLKKYFKFEEPAVYTSRKKRKENEKGERIFLAKQEFLKKVKNKELILLNKIFGNWYAFRFDAFKNINKKNIITEIYIDNVKQFRKNYPKASMIVLVTDDINFLKYRLQKRAENKSELNKRLRLAKQELKKIKSLKNNFNFIYNVNYNNENKIVDEVIKNIKVN